jgi:hypothetical protein
VKADGEKREPDRYGWLAFPTVCLSPERGYAAPPDVPTVSIRVIRVIRG